MSKHWRGKSITFHGLMPSSPGVFQPCLWPPKAPGYLGGGVAKPLVSNLLLLFIVGIRVTTDRRAVFCYDECLRMTLPPVKKYVFVQVTHTFEPNDFCVCFPYGFTSDSDSLGVVIVGFFQYCAIDRLPSWRACYHCLVSINRYKLCCQKIDAVLLQCLAEGQLISK